MASRSERQRARKLAAAEGRGGPRQGTPGTPYANRSDLRAGQAPVAAPGQIYGQAGQQLEAQRAVPISNAGNQLQASAQGMGPNPAMAQLQNVMQQAQAAPGLLDPTQQPQTPLTSGIQAGPGPGPEAVRPPNPLVRAAAALNALGDTADADTKYLRDLINADLANQGAA